MNNVLLGMLLQTVQTAQAQSEVDPNFFRGDEPTLEYKVVAKYRDGVGVHVQFDLPGDEEGLRYEVLANASIVDGSVNLNEDGASKLWIDACMPRRGLDVDPIKGIPFCSIVGNSVPDSELKFDLQEAFYEEIRKGDVLDLRGLPITQQVPDKPYDQDVWGPDPLETGSVEGWYFRTVYSTRDGRDRDQHTKALADVPLNVYVTSVDITEGVGFVLYDERTGMQTHIWQGGVDPQDWPKSLAVLSDLQGEDGSYSTATPQALIQDLPDLVASFGFNGPIMVPGEIMGAAGGFPLDYMQKFGSVEMQGTSPHHVYLLTPKTE